MKKAFALMFLGVIIIFGIIFAIKWYQYEAAKRERESAKITIETVSSVVAKKSSWTPKIKVVGSSRTVKGVNVTTELGGMVREIKFTPGAHINKGDLLVQLDIDPELARLRDLEAQVWLAEVNLKRDRKQYQAGGVSKAIVDRDKATLESNQALAAEEKAIIAQKTIRAPFTGRLGISLVDPGQYLNPGDAVVNLQTLSPIYVDFFIPQSEVPKLKVGQEATISLDTKNKLVFQGKITTINPKVDENVRNIEVEVTLPNEKEQILPGMFMYVILKTGEPKKYITVSQNAITFNPYGAIVYLLKKTNKKHDKKTVWQVQQRFIKTGPVRGDQVAIIKGVNKGETLVSSGQLKIKNGSYVVINNLIQPPNEANPKVSYDG